MWNAVSDNLLSESLPLGWKLRLFCVMAHMASDALNEKRCSIVTKRTSHSKVYHSL